MPEFSRQQLRLLVLCLDMALGTMTEEDAAECRRIKTLLGERIDALEQEQNADA